MKKVAIIGAAGQTMEWLEARLANAEDVELTLFLRHSERIDPAQFTVPLTVIDGDVRDAQALQSAVQGQDMVVVGLEGALDEYTRLIIDAMDAVGAKRVAVILGLGIYDEVPSEFGRWNAAYGGEGMNVFKRAAKNLEDSDLNYTILRAAWMSNRPEVNYETTQKGETFRGTVITRASLADYLVRLIDDPTLDNRASVGLDEPGTDGDRPTPFL
ncbi:NAD(P)H-binding protein [Lacticaseibacillus pabuli]|uniref:NAD(P)H-binding protein n=1 Tax=Lacticaseibacillus pabuli TaxID=3025672 RepID=A0ABY7WU02_9LACO|nr:NAD(P)H-binding protein [Lacticaseibacillus sp. KACC 23028]WDF83269.1 NAD(P)H-binding protein [Lacticaseibacillus sp. KACC 23028]